MIHLSPAEWFFWLVVGFYGLAFMTGMGYAIFKVSHNKTLPTTQPLYRALNNGWVRVNREAFYFRPEEEGRLRDLIEGRLPWEIRRMLFPLLVGERALLIKLDDPYPEISPEEKKKWADNCKRGLTIGSAWFNYPIHPSMVLFDDMTRLAWEYYRRGTTDRCTVGEWQDRYPATFDDNYSYITCQFERPSNLQLDHFVAYYKRHEAFIEKLMLSRINQFEVIPSIDGAVMSCLTQLQQDVSHDATQHYFYCAINVAIRLLKLSVPFEWIMTSELIEQATHHIRHTANEQYKPVSIPKRPQLSLVVSNSSKEN